MRLRADQRDLARFCVEVEEGLEIPSGEVRQRGVGIVGVRVIRVQAHRSGAVLNARCGSAEEDLADRELGEEVGVTRRQSQRPVDVPGRPFVRPIVEQDTPDHDVKHCVAVVELERLVGVVVGRAAIRPELLPEVAAPFIEVGERQTSERPGVARVELERPVEARTRILVRLQAATAKERQTLQRQLVGVERTRRLRSGGFATRVLDPWRDRTRDLRYQILLGREEIRCRDLELFTPDRGSRRPVDQVSRGLKVVAPPRHGAAKQVRPPSRWAASKSGRSATAAPDAGEMTSSPANRASAPATSSANPLPSNGSPPSPPLSRKGATATMGRLVARIRVLPFCLAAWRGRQTPAWSAGGPPSSKRRMVASGEADATLFQAGVCGRRGLLRLSRRMGRC